MRYSFQQLDELNRVFQSLKGDAQGFQALLERNLEVELTRTGHVIFHPPLKETAKQC